MDAEARRHDAGCEVTLGTGLGCSCTGGEARRAAAELVAAWLTPERAMHPADSEDLACRVADAVARAEHDTWTGKREHDVTQCDQCATEAAAAEAETHCISLLAPECNEPLCPKHGG